MYCVVVRYLVLTPNLKFRSSRLLLITKDVIKFSEPKPAEKQRGITRPIYSYKMLEPFKLTIWVNYQRQQYIFGR